jgi:hypothetical protein
MIVNLLRESQNVAIEGVYFALRKWPNRFRHWLTLRMIAGATVDPVTKTYTNLRPMARDFVDLEAEMLEKVFLGVESWGLRGEDDKAIPVNRESVRELYEGFPGYFSRLLEAVESFNNPVSEPEGESSPSASTT